MIEIKKIATPNLNSKDYQVIYEFYIGEKLVGRATYQSAIYKSKLSLDVYHDNDSLFFKLHGLNWQGAGNCLISKTNALEVFNGWYIFLKN